MERVEQQLCEPSLTQGGQQTPEARKGPGRTIPWVLRSWACQHLHFKLTASGTVRQISVILYHSTYGTDFNVYLYLFIFSLAPLGLSCSMWDLLIVPGPGIKPRPPCIGSGES